MLSNVVGLILCVFLLVIWLGIRREDRLARQRGCRHDWEFESLYGEGELWNRRCTLCGKQEPVRKPELSPRRVQPPRR
jgi:hypothetical protein